MCSRKSLCSYSLTPEPGASLGADLVVQLVCMLPDVVPLSHPISLERNGPALPFELAEERLMPSGIFLKEDPSPDYTPVMCNPWFFGSLWEEDIQKIPLKKAQELRARHGEIIEVSSTALDSYSDMITRVRADFSLYPVDAVVVPLCGALRPASLILPMGNFDLTMLPIPFTRGSSGAHDEQILRTLGEQLAPFYGRDPLRLGILDTGIGGQSLIHLVTLLRRLHDDVNPYCEWNIDCKIIIAADNVDYLDNTNVVKRTRNERFAITRKVFPTESLIAEDAKAAISYQVDWGDRASGYVRPVHHSGALVVRRDVGLEVHPTEDVARSLDRQIAEATTRTLQSASNLFIGNVWEPHLKGLI